MSRGDGTDGSSQVGEAEFRALLSRFATGISVITCRTAAGSPRAITVNAFTSVSLAPPLVLYCLGKTAYHFEAFARADSFAINLLSEAQQPLSDRFAREADDSLADLDYRISGSGDPILPESLGVLDCATYARHEAGDHLIMIGCVVAVQSGEEQDPLVYFRSSYRGLRP